MKLLYLDDTKIGRMFKEMFGETVPDSVIAVIAAAVSLIYKIIDFIISISHSLRILLKNMKWTALSVALIFLISCTIKNTLLIWTRLGK